jgi:hypothetical protein
LRLPDVAWGEALVDIVTEPVAGRSARALAALPGTIRASPHGSGYGASLLAVFLPFPLRPAIRSR